MTADELQEIERIWAAASGTQWRTEKQPTYVKLYSVLPPNMHDAYLLDLSDGDANYENNLAAIAKAPEHVRALLDEVKRLRATAQEALDEALGKFDPREGYEMLSHVRDRLGL